MGRDQFTFYRSYYEAIKKLTKKDRESVLMAICAYALDEEETKLDGVSAAVFTLIRPTLDSGRKKAENRTGKVKTSGGQNSKTEKQTKNKSRTNKEQTAKEKEGEKEREKEVEVENDSSPPLSPPGETDPFEEFSGELREALVDWIAYKGEKRQPYKPTGQKALLTKIHNAAKDYGDAATAKIIRDSMAANYQGIVFEWLKKGDGNAARPKNSGDTGNPGKWNISYD